MGFVEQFAALLQRDQDSTYEHLLDALFAMTYYHPAAIAECRRPEFLLKELLENRIEKAVGQEEMKVSFKSSNISIKMCGKLEMINLFYSRKPYSVGNYWQIFSKEILSKIALTITLKILINLFSLHSIL